MIRFLWQNPEYRRDGFANAVKDNVERFVIPVTKFAGEQGIDLSFSPSRLSAESGSDGITSALASVTRPRQLSSGWPFPIS